MSAAPSTLDRIRCHLVGLKMPRALEVLEHTLRQLERGEVSALEAIDALRSCPRRWCRSGAPWRVGPPCQVAMAGKLTGAVSLTVPSVSRLI